MKDNEYEGIQIDIGDHDGRGYAVVYGDDDDPRLHILRREMGWRFGGNACFHGTTTKPILSREEMFAKVGCLFRNKRVECIQYPNQHKGNAMDFYYQIEVA